MLFGALLGLSALLPDFSPWPLLDDRHKTCQAVHAPQGIGKTSGGRLASNTKDQLSKAAQQTNDLRDIQVEKRRDA
jgi:hypothetical protein